MIKGGILVTLFLMVSVLNACSSSDEPKIEPNSRYDIPMSWETLESARNLINFYYEFTSDAVSYIDDDPHISDKNVVVSPLSAYWALSMFANSADVETSKKIMEYLGVKDTSKLNELASILIEELPKVDNQSNVTIANSVWINKNYSLMPSFSHILTQDYKASIYTEDFMLHSTVDKINQWCSERTNGLIPKVLDEISPEKILILVNALYYKGAWKSSPFSEKDTEKGEFHGFNGVSLVDMMYSPEALRNFYRDGNFEYFSLEFGNGAYHMDIVVPSEDLSREAANKLLTYNQWKNFSEKSVECNLTIYMPKFAKKCKVSLNGIFHHKGIEIFDNAILNQVQPVSDAESIFQQYSALEINESGAEIAAVTVDEWYSSDGEELEPGGSYTVRMDRPFYFRIAERSTGACILSGRIADL